MNPIRLPNGRYIRPASGLRAQILRVAEGHSGPTYQATWNGLGYCVGYGPGPIAARERLIEDTVRRWCQARDTTRVDLPPILPDGQPSAALEALDWVLESFTSTEVA